MLSDETAPIPCPNPACEATLEVPLGSIKPGNSTTCPACKATIDFTGADVASGVAKFDDAFQRLKDLASKT